MRTLHQEVLHADATPADNVEQGQPTPASPSHWRVNRWREAFPQYEVGHRARVERIEAALRRDLPGVALAGASLRGSGIPACVASGRQAARALRGRTSGT